MIALIKRNQPDADIVSVKLPIDTLDAVKATHQEVSFNPEHVDDIYDELVIVSTTLPIKSDILENINFNQLNNLANLINWHFKNAGQENDKYIIKNVMNQALNDGKTNPEIVIEFAKIVELDYMISEIVNIQDVYQRIRDFMEFHGDGGLNEIQKYLQELDFDTTREYFIEVDGSHVKVLTKNELEEIVQDMVAQLI